MQNLEMVLYFVFVLMTAITLNVIFKQLLKFLFDSDNVVSLIATSLILVIAIVSYKVASLDVVKVQVDGVEILIAVLLTFICLVSSVLIVKLADIFLWKGLLVSNNRPLVPRIIVRLFNFGVYVVTIFVICTSIFKINVIELVLASGILALIFGYGAQSTLANFFTGISININRTILPGDYIIIGEFEGFVVNLDWRGVIIEDDNANMIIIPNDYFAKKAFTNYGHLNEHRGFNIDIILPYKLRPNRAIEILESAAQQAKKVLSDPKPKAFLLGYDYQGMKYLLKCYTKSPYSYSSRTFILSSIYYQLLRENITIVPLAFKGPENEKLIFNPTVHDHLSFFKSLRFYQLLSEQEKEILINNFQICCYGQFETIISESDISNEIYFIYEGEVTVHHEYDKGQFAPITNYHKRDFFGEMGVLLEEVSSERYVASQEAVLLKIGKSDFNTILEKNKKLAEYLYELIMDRRNTIQAVLEDLDIDEDIDAANQEGLKHKLSGILNQGKDYRLDL